MIGKKISHYQILEKIGAGGMAVVYKAEDLILKRLVALKFLPPHITNSQEAKARLIHEAQAASALDHPNICTIYEIGETDAGDPDTAGLMFIAMAYYEGETLKDRINAGKITIEDAVDFLIQMARGLEAAHTRHIIHRDIKPANLLITGDGTLKILDFGLAKLAGQTMITREGSTLGTVSYMSPEQTTGTEIDHRSDLWAMGVVFYEMLTGVLPFRGDYEHAVMYSILNEESVPVKTIKPTIADDLQAIVETCLKKDPDQRYATAGKVLKDLTEYQKSLLTVGLSPRYISRVLYDLRKPRTAIFTCVALLGIIAVSIWFYKRQANIRWAREIALPQIEQLVEVNWRDFTEPFELAEKAEQYIPDDPRLQALISTCTVAMNIETEPAGADIYVKEYDRPDDEWEWLGSSPLDSVRMPVGIFRWKIEKEGYETVFAASTSWDFGGTVKFMPYHLFRVLDKTGRLPEGMVRVSGAATSQGPLDDFYIDKNEVTNRQFKTFIENGGYRSKQYWKHPFVSTGRNLSFEEAMALFVDQTGRPGPSTWQAGDYPEGQDNYPVSGVSWYEATAYAEYAGRQLPTGTHWGLARGEATPMIIGFQMGGDATFVPFSNFNSEGPVETGILQGVTAFGVNDMAGNVREWCWNQTLQGRLIRGGSWNDNSYMFGGFSQAPAFDRSDGNGFRCILYDAKSSIPQSVIGFIEIGQFHDFYKDTPVPDNIYRIYEQQFKYDQTDLNSRILSQDSSSADWITERIELDAAYGNEKILAVLFLPKNTRPPFQTVIYFPGSQAIGRPSSTGIDQTGEFMIFLSFILKTGRAVLYPVYKGTMERIDNAVTVSEVNSYRRLEYRIQVVKDLRRSLDYLSTRPDIDSDKLAYFGMSWGANWPAALILAVEPRLKTGILLAGALSDFGRQEVRPVNYIKHIKIPVLMLNGRYDSRLEYEHSIKPLYDMLGTPPQHKVLKLYDTDHIPPKNEFIKEILNWLDRYLGPVK